MQLRPYQNDLVEQVRQAWREGYKAPCIVLGCGGGKSCIVAEIARRTTWNGKRVLFLVHRRELVDQIFRTFVRWGVLMDLCQIGMVQTFTKDGRYFNTGVPPGFSDLFGVRKSDGRAVFIEVKTPKGRPTEKQQKFIQMMKLNGAVAGICRSADEAIELITKE